MTCHADHSTGSHLGCNGRRKHELCKTGSGCGTARRDGIGRPGSSIRSIRCGAIIDEDDRQILNTNGGKRFVIYSGHFLDHVQLDKDRHDRDWKDKRDMVEATYGWAITCHKSQGSQWQNVIVYDDRLSRNPEDRNRWLYTAITRAEEGLVILD